MVRPAGKVFGAEEAGAYVHGAVTDEVVVGGDGEDGGVAGGEEHAFDGAVGGLVSGGVNDGKGGVGAVFLHGAEAVPAVEDNGEADAFGVVNGTEESEEGFAGGLAVLVEKRKDLGNGVKGVVAVNDEMGLRFHVGVG